MKNHKSLRQQFDACRDARDLDWPEMAELARGISADESIGKEFSHCREFDHAVAQALSDVPVPAGLAERLLAAVAAAEPVMPDQRAIRRSHRWHATFFSRAACYGWATLAAALLLLVGGGYYWRSSHQIFEQEQIASALGGWQKAADRNHSERGLPRDFELPPLDVKPVRYVPFKTQEGWSAVAVDCTTPAGRPATLFIVQSSAKFGAGALPIPQFAASGKKVAAWRKGRLLYVLVEEVAKPRAGAAIHYSGSPPA